MRSVLCFQKSSKVDHEVTGNIIGILSRTHKLIQSIEN